VERVISDLRLESKQTVKKTSLSFHRLRLTQIRISLNLLAESLGNLWRRLALSERTEIFTLLRQQQRSVIGGRRASQYSSHYRLSLLRGRRPGRAI
jgi:hypothetical protein